MASSSATDNSAFSPRTNPRPKYPSFFSILNNWFWLYTRDAWMGVCFVYFLRGAYEQLRQYLGWGDRAFYALTIVMVQNGCFILFSGGIYIFDDILGWLAPYRFHRKANEVADSNLKSKLHLETFINHCITTPIIAYYMFFAAEYFGTPSASAPLPSYQEIALVMLAAHAFNDVGFYWTHRLFHAKMFYRHFHKKHHTFRGTVFASAEYANPVEVVIANQLPTIGLVMGLGCHPLVQAAWLSLRLIQTYEVHSGYAVEGTWLHKLGIAAGGAAFHDHHHTTNMGNFGAEHMDYIFGTMDYWVRDGGEKGYWEKHQRGGIKDTKEN